MQLLTRKKWRRLEERERFHSQSPKVRKNSKISRKCNISLFQQKARLVKRGYCFSYCKYFIVWMLVHEDVSAHENPCSEW